MKARCLALGFLLLACSGRKPAPTIDAGSTDTRYSASASVCHNACNGDFGIHGRSQRPTCLCRTRDAGQPCRSRDDCRGECVLDDPIQTEVVDPGPPARGYFVGKCAEFTITYGCRRRLPKTVGKLEPVDLSSPPAVSCVD